MPTPEEVTTVLKDVFDPEIPVNIVDLGLIYNVAVEGSEVKIQMTLTSQACPEARTIPEVMKRKVNEMEGIEGCEVEIVWDPMWTPQLITEDGRRILGIDED